MFKFRPFPPIKSFSHPFGLDISDLSLKLVSLNKKRGLGSKNKSIGLLHYDQIAVPPGYFVEGKIIETTKIIRLIKELVKKNTRNGKLSDYVISVLPETKALIKVIEIPLVEEEKIPEVINKEIKNHFPFSDNEVYLDWQIATGCEATEETIKILVSIAPKEIVDSYTELLINAGLKPFALEIESSAICRALLPEEIDTKNQENYPQAGTGILDIGATRTSLIFYDSGTIQFTTSIPFSGQRVTEKIAERLKITTKEAEKAKIKCGLSDKKCQGIIQNILHKDIEEMIEKIKNSMSFYQKHFEKNNPIKKLIICGGGANFQGIDKILKKEFKINVEVANPLININEKGAKLVKSEGLSYTTAIGLALRGILIND